MAKIENTMECLRELMDVMSEKGITTFEYANGDFDIKLGRKVEVYNNALPICGGAADIIPAAVPVTGKCVKSPIVGTYYNCPAPGKPAFIEVGQRVKKGDVLMIIESMKLMNEITSEYDGVVAEIMVENGAAVDFEQEIIRID